MIHWTTAVIWCLMSGLAGFMAAAVLNLRNEEKRINKP